MKAEIIKDLYQQYGNRKYLLSHIIFYGTIFFIVILTKNIYLFWSTSLIVLPICNLFFVQKTMNSDYMSNFWKVQDTMLISRSRIVSAKYIELIGFCIFNTLFFYLTSILKKI